jgi:hypothetical protein
MAEGTGRQRGMSRHEGLRSDRGQRSGPPEQERDLQTEIEDELLTSGRSHIAPREGLIGAYVQRREPVMQDPERRQVLPVGRGSDVAPTRKAELREATRHDLEAEVGRVAAGEDPGLERGRRGPHATREALDGLAAEADDLLARRRVNAEGYPIGWAERAGTWLRENSSGWPERAGTWLRENRTAVVAGAGVAAVAVGCFALARRRH